MNFPYSNTYNPLNPPDLTFQQNHTNNPQNSIPNSLLRCFDSFNNLMYVQILPVLPSFYSFHNCDRGFATLNTLFDERKNEIQDHQIEEFYGRNALRFQSKTLKNLDEIQKLSDQKIQQQKAIEYTKKNEIGLSEKKVYKQNPTRNIFTNIGNQLITFVSSKRKSIKYIKLIKQEWINAQIQEYYTYVKNYKKQFGYYLNLSKIANFWYPKKNNISPQFHKIIRCISRHFLTEIITLSILTSRKMKKQSKNLHLKARKQLLQRLDRCY